MLTLIGVVFASQGLAFMRVANLVLGPGCDQKTFYCKGPCDLIMVFLQVGRAGAYCHVLSFETQPESDNRNERNTIPRFRQALPCWCLWYMRLMLQCEAVLWRRAAKAKISASPLQMEAPHSTAVLLLYIPKVRRRYATFRRS